MLKCFAIFGAAIKICLTENVNFFSNVLQALRIIFQGKFDVLGLFKKVLFILGIPSKFSNKFTWPESDNLYIQLYLDRSNQNSHMDIII